MESMKDMETALAKIKSLEEMNDRLTRERDDAIRKSQESRPRSELRPSSSGYLPYKEYSRKDIKSATRNFSERSKVGEGEYGVVCRGQIEETAVAVKIKEEDDSTLDEQKFLDLMEVVRGIRHPHLVRVVGICLKRGCIVYEYMANGSLADYLSRKNDTSPLLWHDRVRIASEVCSALHHLHSLKPNGILHCSLKPENILLNEFYTSKISDVGIGRLLSKKSFIQANTYYMDPDYLRTDKFTDKSDVYSLGIIILRLLTSKRACGLLSKVTTSLESKQLDNLLDPSAGWPSEQALQLANLALRCTLAYPRERPDLTEVLDEIQVIASRIVQPARERQVPSFFTCPISKEIMDDPHITADGNTYELKKIKKWFDSGKDTSPKTNLRLDNTNLIPNHCLKSAIREWKEATSPLP